MIERNKQSIVGQKYFVLDIHYKHKRRLNMNQWPNGYYCHKVRSL